MTFKADLLTLLQTAHTTIVSKVINEEARKTTPILTHIVTAVFDGDTCEEDSIFVSHDGPDSDFRFSTQEVNIDKEGNYRATDIFGVVYEFSSTWLVTFKKNI